jgi:16S rRNA (uracil1498-N3)-methyltransferase
MHKFFTPKETFTDTHAIISGDDVKHIYRVLRLENGEKIAINNLEGKEYLGEIEEITKQYVKVKIVEELGCNNESNINITLFQGLPKSTKMDLIVQKCTELGIRKITPLITNRVDVKLKGEFKKLDRLHRIALEASKQSKRTIIPDIDEPVEFDRMIDMLSSMDMIVVPYENATGYGIRNAISEIGEKTIKNIAIVIGPEGGFEEYEIDNLKKSGANIVTLGPRILRTETAGFTAVSLLQYELGDIGGNNQ